MIQFLTNLKIKNKEGLYSPVFLDKCMLIVWPSFTPPHSTQTHTQTHTLSMQATHTNYTHYTYILHRLTHILRKHGTHITQTHTLDTHTHLHAIGNSILGGFSTPNSQEFKLQWDSLLGASCLRSYKIPHFPYPKWSGATPC